MDNAGRVHWFVAIYVFSRLVKSRLARLAAYPAIAVLLGLLLPPDAAPLYICFAVGAAMRDAHVSAITARKVVVIALLAIGLLIGGMSQFAKPPASFYGQSDVFEVMRMYILMIWTLAASLIVLSVLISASLRRLLAGAVGRFLGRISFALYLTHFPILGSLGAGLWLTIGRNSATGFILVTIAYLLAVFLAAIGFETLVDRPSISLSHWLRRRLTDAGSYDARRLRA